MCPVQGIPGTSVRKSKFSYWYQKKPLKITFNMQFTDLNYLNNIEILNWNMKLTKYGGREIVILEKIAWEDHCTDRCERPSIGVGRMGGCCPQDELIDRLNPIYQTRNRREDNLIYNIYYIDYIEYNIDFLGCFVTDINRFGVGALH